MAINSMEFSTRCTEELDKVFVQKSVTGFMTDNALRAKFVGAKTVIIADMDMQGLADYDRDTGFTRGTLTVSNTPYTMACDRGRSFQIDREDNDESGVAQLAGQVLGEFVRTKVAPEADAYVLSKLAGLAATRGQLLTDGSLDGPYAAFCSLVAAVQNEVGYDEELVAFVDPTVWAAFQNSSELSRMLTVSHFRQGEIDLSVKAINGIPVLPVPFARMRTAFTFLDGTTTGEEEGGFAPAAGARGVYMLVLPRKAASLVRKSEQLRAFSPEQNLTADAYKFDYRLYYDLFVKKSALGSVFAWLAPAVTVSAQPQNKSVTAGSISGSLSVTATADDGSTPTYQWFACDASGADATRVAGATAASMTLDTTLSQGTYHYFCRVTAGGSTVSDSAVATVTVS